MYIDPDHFLHPNNLTNSTHRIPRGETKNNLDGDFFNLRLNHVVVAKAAQLGKILELL